MTYRRISICKDLEAASKGSGQAAGSITFRTYRLPGARVVLVEGVSDSRVVMAVEVD